MIGIVRTGFWAMIGGALSVVAVMVQGVGPCGPRSALGAFLLVAGESAAVIGFLTVVVAFAWNAIRRSTHG